MSIYWFEKRQTITPSYIPTLLFDRECANIKLKNPCCICRNHMNVKDMRKVTHEMVENGWTHPGPGTILCNKESCRRSFTSTPDVIPFIPS